MSTSTVHGPNAELAGDVQEKVTAEAAMEVGDSTPPALVPTEEVLRWFAVVEVPELGFRAFCRLPNEYQHADLREKALAAKSRRVRQYRADGTDAQEILESELEEIAALPEDEAKGDFVAELLLRTFLEDRQRAVGFVMEREEFEHVRKDQERYLELDAMSEEERSNDEYLEVLEHLSKFGEAIEQEIEDIRKPRREALMALSVDELKEQVRDIRIKNQGQRAFSETYGFHQTFVGTLQIPDGFDVEKITPETMPTKRVFESEDALRNADPQIVAKLMEAFEELESALDTRAAGN